MRGGALGAAGVVAGALLFLNTFAKSGAVGMAAMEASGPSFSRDVLSSHETRATYTGVEAGMEPMLRIFPPQPAKQWAVFAITEYISYSKPGQYGDEQTERFAFVAEEQSEAVSAALAALTPGQNVLLSWDHEYVTRAETIDGHETSSSYPERIVTKLEPV